MRVSVAIPVFNEQQVLTELLQRLRGALAGIPGGPHEMVLVDDGSADRTAEIPREEAERDRRILGILFSRNFVLGLRGEFYEM